MLTQDIKTINKSFSLISMKTVMISANHLFRYFICDESVDIAFAGEWILFGLQFYQHKKSRTALRKRICTSWPQTKRQTNSKVTVAGCWRQEKWRYRRSMPYLRRPLNSSKNLTIAAINDPRKTETKVLENQIKPKIIQVNQPNSQLSQEKVVWICSVFVGNQTSSTLKNIASGHHRHCCSKNCLYHFVGWVWGCCACFGQMRTFEHHLCISTAQVENLCHFEGGSVFDNLVADRINATRWNLARVFLSSC